MTIKDDFAFIYEKKEKKKKRMLIEEDIQEEDNFEFEERSCSTTWDM